MIAVSGNKDGEFSILDFQIYLKGTISLYPFPAKLKENWHKFDFYEN